MKLCATVKRLSCELFAKICSPEGKKEKKKGWLATFGAEAEAAAAQCKADHHPDHTPL